MSKRGRSRRAQREGQPLLPSRLPGVVRALARWAVVSAAGLGGCKSQPVADPPWSPIECDPQTLTPTLLAHAELARSIDYVAILQRLGPSFGAAESVAPLTERGVPCANAAPRDACLAEVERQKAKLRCSERNGRCPSALLTTHGDAVVTSLDRAALQALLGTLDNRDEAAALAMFDGFTIACPESVLTGTRTRVRGNAFELDSEWEECGTGIFHQQLTVSSNGAVKDHGKQQVGKSNCVIGRRPSGLCLAPAAHADDALAAFFATSAQLEAASVYAFERLARELAALRAPLELVAAAARSALEEVRHARVVGMLARRAGATPSPPRVPPLPLRAPFAIALENAVEGCVRESYGALVAHHQALVAGDPLVRAVMAMIAEDETRHAQLAWRVARWLEPRLSRPQRPALHEARRTALHELGREVDMGLSAAAARAIGWPQPEHALQLIARFGRALALC